MSEDSDPERRYNSRLSSTVICAFGRMYPFTHPGAKDCVACVADDEQRAAFEILTSCVEGIQRYPVLIETVQQRPCLG